MPELPEVETIRRIVERTLVGRRVAAIDLRLPKLMRQSPLPTLDPLVGQQVLAADRRAKVLLLSFSGDLSLLVHFKLAGQLAVIESDGTRHVAGHPIPDPTGPYPHKATHLTVTFDSGTTAYLSDVRQFGWLRLMPSVMVSEAIERFRFGPEGTGVVSGAVDASALRGRLGRRRIALKSALLDQRVIAGLGNIYVDEALHHARLHPAQPANRPSAAEIDRLAEAIPWALDQGIAQGGAKIVRQRATPRDGFPAVHGREGEPCFTCGTPILKIRVGGRGTYLCPICQPEVAIVPMDDKAVEEALT